MGKKSKGRKSKGKKPKGRAPSADAGAAAAAAEQLGSVSLGESMERKDNDVEPNAKNGTPTKLCSACGKGSNTAKMCTACKCVWYCDKECQNKHRKEHRNDCKRIKKELDKRGGELDIGSELDLSPLSDLPPREECPICMHALPLHPMLHTYFNCCGKTICSGCTFQHMMKSGEQGDACAFCRTTTAESDEEELARLSKRIERNDPHAMRNLAMMHVDGRFGLPVDQTKCLDLMRQSASLGFPGAHYELGLFHHQGRMGLEQNNEEAQKYYKKAAEGGDIFAIHNLAWAKKTNGDHVAAMFYWRLSASAGSKRSMGSLTECYERGFLHHGDLAETLRAFYRSRAEMRSDDRDKCIGFLKEAGQYEADYD